MGQFQRVTENSGGNGFLPYLKYILDNSGLTKPWRFFEGEDFEQNIQELAKEATPPKSFALNCRTLRRLLIADISASLKSAQEGSKAVPLSRDDPLLRIKSRIMNCGTFQDQIVLSAHHIATKHSPNAPQNLNAFRECLAFYSLASNTKEALYIIPQEFCTDLFEFMNSFLPGVNESKVKFELGRISQRKRKNKSFSLSNMHENFFSSYKGKYLHQVRNCFLSFRPSESVFTPSQITVKKESSPKEEKKTKRRAHSTSETSS